MKILLVSKIFYPAISGVVVHFDHLAKELVLMGHKVDILCGGEKEKIENYSENIKLIRFIKPSAETSIEKLDGFEKNSLETMKKLDFNKYDLVISGYDVFLNNLKNSVPEEKILFIVPSLTYIAENLYENTKDMKEKLKKMLKGIKLITLSNFVKQDIQNKLDITNNIFVTRLGVDHDKFSCNLNEKENLILYVGRISFEKNIEALLRAYDLTKQNHKLIIIGAGGEYKREVLKVHKTMGKKNAVSFLNKIIHPYEYFKKAKVFVLPSRYDQFPITLLEAMAAGIPCIAFEPDGKNITTGVKEIITNGRNGFLVKDEKEMAEKIDLLLTDNELRLKMAKQAIEDSKQYSWEKNAKEILEIAKL